MNNQFLSEKFIEAMNDIGRYGHEKYGEDRAIAGDTSRGTLARWESEVIRDHAAAHFQMHIDGTPHDHFKTRRHQLAAVAFNAMMEFYFAGLESEP